MKAYERIYIEQHDDTVITDVYFLYIHRKRKRLERVNEGKGYLRIGAWRCKHI